MLPKDRDEDLHINHWFFSSQYTPEEIKRAEHLISPLEKLKYHFIDFDMPDEKDSQRYIHVQQSFIECNTNLDLTKQRLAYMRDTLFPLSDLSAGKCLIFTHTIDFTQYQPTLYICIHTSLLDGSTKVKLSQTSAAMYNIMHGNVIHWSETGLQYPLFIKNENAPGMIHGISINDPKFDHRLREQPAWKLVLHGPVLPYADRGGPATNVLDETMRETAKMILEVVSLSKSRTIIELEFHRTDLLGPQMIASSDFRPLTHLRRAHILNCRLISMHSVARYLPSFRSKMPSFEIVFTYRKPETPERNGEPWHGAVLCYLFLWRHSRPNKFIESMLHDTRFRRYIENYVGSIADDWYQFGNRAYPTDSNWEEEDRELLRIFNGGSLASGSNAASLQEERTSCHLVMPGLCYPKARRNTGDSETCHGCRVNDIVLEQSGMGYSG